MAKLTTDGTALDERDHCVSDRARLLTSRRGCRGPVPTPAAARLHRMARPAQLQADRGNPRLKFLDRYVGIPATATLSLRRRLRGARPLPEHWHTIGILLTAGIGDTVVASGIIRDLRVAWPTARIVVFVTANNADFARLLTDPDEIVELPVRKIPTAVRMIRAEACDVILDLNAWTRFAAVLAELSGARFTVPAKSTWRTCSPRSCRIVWAKRCCMAAELDPALRAAELGTKITRPGHRSAQAQAIRRQRHLRIWQGRSHRGRRVARGGRFQDAAKQARARSLSSRRSPRSRRADWRIQFSSRLEYRLFGGLEHGIAATGCPRPPHLVGYFDTTSPSRNALVLLCESLLSDARNWLLWRCPGVSSTTSPTS